MTTVAIVGGRWNDYDARKGMRTYRRMAPA